MLHCITLLTLQDVNTLVYIRYKYISLDTYTLVYISRHHYWPTYSTAVAGSAFFERQLRAVVTRVGGLKIMRIHAGLVEGTGTNFIR